ncbi:solute carrier family 35 member G1-like [Ptychodera flava]|uniref:solute carrier family 35 member G1-like n=1 Tax=Ptychodera flava TaxID=63121 RepID=UPI00396A6B5E
MANDIGELERLVNGQAIKREKEIPPDKAKVGFCHSMLGISLALLAGIFSTCENTLFAVLARFFGVKPYQMLLIMFAGSLVAMTPAVLCLHGLKAIAAETWKQRAILVNIGVWYTVADFCEVFALTMIPIGNMTAICRGIIPIITPAFARIFLKKPFTKVHLIGTVLCLAGILLTAQPDIIFRNGNIGTPNAWIGYLLSGIGGVAFSITYVSCSALGDDVNTLVINFYENVAGSIISLVLALSLGSLSWNLEFETIWLLSGLVVSYLLTFLCRFRSLQLESPSTCVLLANIQIVVAYLAEYIVFRHTPNLYDIIGAIAIIFCSVIIVIATAYSNMKGEQPDGG